MATDPSAALRLLHNERLRRSLGPTEYRDLGGALAMTSDAPVAGLNHLEAFTTEDARIESLLDIGFALLRAFDREPAVLVTALDRPESLPARLRRRGLAPSSRSVVLALTRRGAPHASATVDVHKATADDIAAFTAIACAGAPRWARTLLQAEAMAGLHEPGHTFLIASTGGRDAGVLHLLCEGGTAGIDSVVTLKSQRRRGVCSALLSAASVEAEAAGCDLMGLRVPAESEARAAFEQSGFSAVLEAWLWAPPPAP
jgi:GNAT superfamily N-acetyltransferase